jgi:hypothetical protein
VISVRGIGRVVWFVVRYCLVGGFKLDWEIEDRLVVYGIIRVWVNDRHCCGFACFHGSFPKHPPLSKHVITCSNVFALISIRGRECC